jgi:4-hydroxyphenylpyruvate dioxygenase
MRLDQIAINSVSTRHDSLADAFAAYAEAGFRLVELDIEAARGVGAETVAELLAEHSLRCIGGFDGELMCFGGRAAAEASVAALAESARFVAALGGGGVLVFGTDGPAARSDDPIAQVADVARHAVDAIADLDVTLALEFNWSPVIRSLASAVAVSDAVDDPRLGVLFDPAHYYTTPTKLEDLTAHAVSRIVRVHMNDMPDIPADLAHWNDDRVLPGTGILPLGEMLERLEAHGYAGAYALEMFGEDLWSLPVREAAERSYAAMARLCD